VRHQTQLCTLCPPKRELTTRRGTPRRFIAATHGSQVQVWQTPSHLAREFAPFVLHRTYTGHYDDVLSIQWSSDSRCAPSPLALSRAPAFLSSRPRVY